MSYGMRAKPKKGGPTDRQRLTPLTTGARQTPLYGNKGIGGQDGTGLKHTKKGLQYDDKRIENGEPDAADLEQKLALENSVTTSSGRRALEIRDHALRSGRVPPVVAFDMAISGDPIGPRDDLEGRRLPGPRELRSLCTGEHGGAVKGSSRDPLVPGLPLPPVIPDFMAKGDITRNNGSGATPSTAASSKRT